MVEGGAEIVAEQGNPTRTQDGPRLDRKCLLVLGMHRSGTSALTRILSLAGAELPLRLMKPNAYNSAGYWEPLHLQQYHDALLNELNSTWQDWQPLAVDRLSENRRGEIIAEIRNIVETDYPEASLFVLKDPRICRFAPLVTQALTDMSVTPEVVLPFRNPLEVGDSLAARDGMSRSDAALLWLRHNLDAEHFSRPHKRFLLPYDNMLDDWQEMFSRLSEALSVSWSFSDFTHFADQVDGFLNSELRHHQRSAGEMQIDPAVSGWVSKTFAAMHALARTPDSKAVMQELDTIRTQFDAACPFLFNVQADARRGMQEKLQQAQDRIENLSKRLDESELKTQQLSEEALQLTCALEKRQEELETAWKAQTLERNRATRRQESLSTIIRQWVDYEEEHRRETQKLADSVRVKDAVMSQQTDDLERERARSRELSRNLQERSQEDLKNRVLLRNEQCRRQSLESTLAGRLALSLNGILVRIRQVGPYGRNPEHHMRLRELVASSGLFDEDFYLKQNPEVLEAGLDSLDHYLVHGGFEGRSPSKLFDTEWYLAQYPDVLEASINPLVHFLQHGKAEGRLAFAAKDEDIASAQAESPAKEAPPPPQSNFGACFVHIYYVDVWPSLQTYVDRLVECGCDVFVNVVDSQWTPELHQRIRTAYPGARIRISENAGRDVGGHFNSFRDVDFDSYKYAFLIHTKKSTHITTEKSAKWRNELLNAFAGNCEQIRENMKLFDDDPSVGLIASKRWRMSNIESNQYHHSRILDKLRIPEENRDCDYISGTMMMIRPSILKFLYEGLRDEIFENSECRDKDWLWDGQIEHAIERSIGNATRSLNFRSIYVDEDLENVNQVDPNRMSAE